MEKLHKYVLYGVDTSVKVEEIQTELRDSLGLLINPSTAIKLILNKEGFLHPRRSVLIFCKVELSGEIFLYGMSLFTIILSPSPYNAPLVWPTATAKNTAKSPIRLALSVGKQATQLVNALSQTLSAEIVTVRDTQPSKNNLARLTKSES